MKQSKVELIIHLLFCLPFLLPGGIIINVNSLVSALLHLAPGIWVPSKCIVLKFAF